MAPEGNEGGKAPQETLGTDPAVAVGRGSPAATCADLVVPQGVPTHPSDERQDFPSPEPERFLRGGGEMGALMRAKDWSATPLGPTSGWPQSLRTCVSTCLNCSFPIAICWGPEFLLLYNDAYTEILADKRLTAMGLPCAEVWPEIWGTIGPMLEQARREGEAVPADDLLLTMNRRGYLEECYFSFSYGPVLDEAGEVGGIYCPVMETTKRVLSERRSKFLLDLEERLRPLSDPLEIKAAASAFLGQHIGAAQVGYAEVVNDGADVLIAGEWNDGRLPSTAGQHRLAEYGPAMVEDLRRGEVIRIDDLGLDPRTRHEATVAAYAKFSIASLLAVPMVKEGQLTAVLFMHHFAPRHWSDADVSFASDLAERTWSAVGRASAEAALRRSEQDFRNLGENLPNLCWMARADGYIYWYNRVWHDYTGKTPAEMEGWGWQSVHDPERLPEIMEKWTAAIATGSRFEMTFPLRGADGVFRPFLTRIVPIRDAEGRISRWFGNNVDISEITETESRLRRSEAQLLELNDRLEQMVEARTVERDRMWRLSTDVMLVARFDGTIVAANPAWTTMLGWSTAELLDRSFLDLVHPEDIAATLEQTGVLSDGQTVFHFENRYRHRDGGYHWLAWSAVPDAGLIHAVGRDVTALKDAAAQLETTRERLRQSQRMEALGQLAGGIAHDFNNVLQSVSSGVNLIDRRAEDPAAVKKIARMVADASARGSAITGRLLSFSRQGELQSAPVDTDALLQGLAEMLTHTLGPGVTVRTEVAPGTPTLFADKAQLETVLVNLAVNARDAMPDGGTLTISASTNVTSEAAPGGPGDGDYIKLTIADTGAGMDEAILARAGDPFFTTKPPGQGTGLGLAMARGFSEQSGGGFSIASKLGHGTTITLWLPRTGISSETLDGQQGTAIPADPSATRRVLLVDDDSMVRLLLAAHLEDVGYDIVQASDGLDALARLDDGEDIDLLVTDFAMPGMNGLALIQEARKRLPELPVLLLTGYADAGVRDRLIDDTTVDTVMLRKPVSPEELASRAAALLDAHAQAAD